MVEHIIIYKILGFLPDNIGIIIITNNNLNFISVDKENLKG